MRLILNSELSHTLLIPSKVYSVHIEHWSILPPTSSVYIINWTTSIRCSILWLLYLKKKNVSLQYSKIELELKGSYLRHVANDNVISFRIFVQTLKYGNTLLLENPMIINLRLMMLLAQFFFWGSKLCFVLNIMISTCLLASNFNQGQSSTVCVEIYQMRELF